MLHAEECALERLKEQRELVHADPRVEGIDHQILIHGLTLVLAVQQLHTLDAAHRFQQVGLLLSDPHDVLLLCLPQRAIEGEPE